MLYTPSELYIIYTQLDYNVLYFCTSVHAIHHYVVHYILHINTCNISLRISTNMEIFYEGFGCYIQYIFGICFNTYTDVYLLMILYIFIDTIASIKLYFYFMLLIFLFFLLTHYLVWFVWSLVYFFIFI